MKLKKLEKAQTPQNRLIMCKAPNLEKDGIVSYYFDYYTFLNKWKCKQVNLSRTYFIDNHEYRSKQEQRMAAAYTRAHGGKSSQTKDSRRLYVLEREAVERVRNGNISLIFLMLLVLFIELNALGVKFFGLQR